VLPITGDARRLFLKRGAPLRISVREDGTLALRYEEQRPCGIDSCRTTVDYVFDGSGKLLRDEVVGRVER
jgi:hypothetical protein